MRRRGPRSKEYVSSLEKRLKEAEDMLKHSPAKYEIGEVTPNDSLDRLNDPKKLQMDILTGYFEFCYPFLDIIPKALIMRKISKMPPFYLNSIYCISSWVMHKHQATSSMYYDECKKRLASIMENSSIFNIIGLINLVLYTACINNSKFLYFLLKMTQGGFFRVWL